MKLLTLAALAAASIASAAHAAETPLNLLFFGNSYSQGGLPYRLAELAQADGHARPVVLLDSMGGMDLPYHINEVAANPQNNVAHPIVGNDTWDFVVQQAHSNEATKLYKGNYQQNALNLFTAVRDHASGRGAGVKAVQLETWARAAGNTEHFYPEPGYPNPPYTGPAAMQADITTRTAAASANINAVQGAGSSVVAPVGQAFGAMNWNASLYQTDLHHPSGAGNLLESMIVYRTIYGENVGDISFAQWQAVNGKLVSDFSKVDEATWLQLRAVADSIAIVPEPASLAAVTGALGSLLVRRRRRAGTSR